MQLSKAFSNVPISGTFPSSLTHLFKVQLGLLLPPASCSYLRHIRTFLHRELLPPASRSQSRYHRACPFLQPHAAIQDTVGLVQNFFFTSYSHPRHVQPFTLNWDCPLQPHAAIQGNARLAHYHEFSSLMQLFKALSGQPTTSSFSLM